MTRIFRLSKSKLLSGHQCHKRLWLETHRPELAQVSQSSEHIFRMGHLFGDKARTILGSGQLIEHARDIGQALLETPAALERAVACKTSVYEAAFKYRDVVSRADAFAPNRSGWHLTEVKAATSDKAYFHYDCAVQVWVAEGAGYPVNRVTLALVNKEFVYPGGEDYSGLIRKMDVTDTVKRLTEDVGAVVNDLQTMLSRPAAPGITTGRQCNEPFDCPFIDHCKSTEPPESEFPVELFGQLFGANARHYGWTDALAVPVTALDAKQVKHRQAMLDRRAIFDYTESLLLRAVPYPRHYLDFETVASPVPLWAGTRPYQSIPFQWSCHTEVEPGALVHSEFMDVSGDMPVREFARRLIETVGKFGTVVVYSSFEQRRLDDLCRLVPEYQDELRDMTSRIVDLLQIVRRGYFHPAAGGSYLLNRIAATMCADLDYSTLGEVADGMGAHGAWWHATSPGTPSARRREIIDNMLMYNKHNTLSLAAVYRSMELMRPVVRDELGENPTQVSTVIFSAR
ncbi:DUF2779 domain-containing protein [Caballeronia grimmiae]|uniref:DUF2779 domain-containing protein n=1 Tax=Caballeronia grimmiae TaxID=1071679 RepID=UPI0038BB14DC